MSAISDWENKTITLEVCSVGFPGVKVMPPDSRGGRATEVDSENRKITLHVQDAGYVPTDIGQIEFKVARTWRDVFCVQSGGTGGIPELSSIVTHINYYRDAGSTCGAERSSGPVPHVVWNERLANAGIAHSRNMIENGFIAHNDPEGQDVGDRILTQGYVWETSGENITVGPDTIVEAMSAWMNSPIHCANMMSPSFTEVGVGVVADGNGRKYWTMVLASPVEAEEIETERAPCCIENSVWWKRGSRQSGDGYVLDDTPMMYVTLPGYCQWMLTTIRTYMVGPTEETWATIRSRAGFGGGGFVSGMPISDNRIVPGMGIKQLDYYEVGEQQPAEIEACQTIYCTCCITGGEVLVSFGKILRVALANGEAVYARASDHVQWEPGDWVFMIKNRECANIGHETDVCRDACEIEIIPGFPFPEEQDCPYMIVPFRIGSHGA